MLLKPRIQYLKFYTDYNKPNLFVYSFRILFATPFLRFLSENSTLARLKIPANQLLVELDIIRFYFAWSCSSFFLIDLLLKS